MEYTELLEQLSMASGQSVKELLEPYLRTLPNEWYQDVFTLENKAMPGHVWRFAREQSGLPFPPVLYGITTDDHPIPPAMRDLYTERNQRSINEIIDLARRSDYLCRGMEADTFEQRSHTIIYAYYMDDVTQEPVVIGILLLFFLTHELLIPMMCTDGSYQGIGRALIDMAKQVSQHYKLPIKVDSLPEARSFYLKQGFVPVKDNLLAALLGKARKNSRKSRKNSRKSRKNSRKSRKNSRKSRKNSF
jgi:hypothetical protein